MKNSSVSKKKMGIVIGSAVFGLFILICFLVAIAPPTNQLADNTKVTPTQKPLADKQIVNEHQTPQSTTSPIPSPSDWISNPNCPLSVPDFEACLRDKYPLKATVRADSLDLYIANTQNMNWTNCTVSLADGSYGMNLFDKFAIKSGATVGVSWGKLVDDNGNRFNYINKQPGAVDIICVVNHEQHSSQYNSF